MRPQDGGFGRWGRARGAGSADRRAAALPGLTSYLEGVDGPDPALHTLCPRSGTGHLDVGLTRQSRR